MEAKSVIESCFRWDGKVIMKNLKKLLMLLGFVVWGVAVYGSQTDYLIKDYDQSCADVINPRIVQMFVDQGWIGSDGADFVVQQYLQRNCCKLAYAPENKIVGFIFFQAYKPHLHTIVWLLVDNTERKKGCGSLLLSAALRDIFVLSQAHKKSFTVSLNPSYSAMSFYKRHGFVINENKTQSMYQGSDRIEIYVMEKVLGAHSKEISNIMQTRSTLFLSAYMSGIVKPLKRHTAMCVKL